MAGTGHQNGGTNGHVTIQEVSESSEESDEDYEPEPVSATLVIVVLHGQVLVHGGVALFPQGGVAFHMKITQNLVMTSSNILCKALPNQSSNKWDFKIHPNGPTLY